MKQKADQIVGRHLYRVKFCFLCPGLQFMLNAFLNVTTAKSGIGPAGDAVMKIFATDKFKEIYPGAILQDISYFGTLDA